MWWGSFSVGVKPYVWDPVANTHTATTEPGYNIFCGGHSLLENGQVFVTGGDFADSTGVPNASIYDPVGGSWTFLPNMNAGRWYPTNTVLPNGDVLVTSGEITPGQDDPLPQVWQVSTGTWRDLTTGQFLLPLYPPMFVAPNGLVFYAGPVSGYLNTDGTGSWTTGPSFQYGARGYGPSVMYNNGQILITGGGTAPTNTAETINLNDPAPVWKYTGSMAFPRRQANATVLPDGTVLVTGGTSGAPFDDYTNPVYPAELWNPTTGTWSTLASMSVYRGYHSVATLLPDATVLTAGGQCPVSPCSPNSAQIYSPPYLFKGSRPTIASAPTSISGGKTFFVGTPDAANVTQVSWIRLGAVTHTFNQEQRFSFLSFTQATGGLNVTAPPSANLAPAGYYMLFLLNGSGVPSVASIIQVDNSSFVTPGPGVSVSTALLAFAVKPQVGTTSASRPVQLTNLGTTPVTINSITTGPDFTVTSNTCSSPLAPGSCTINVAFKPTTGGPVNEFLTISDSDSSSPQTVALSGTATALKVPVTSVNFGNRPIGKTSPPVPITLTNLGSSAISISSINYTNSEFRSSSSTCGTSIPGLSNCQIFSTFTPNAGGTQNGSFTVSDSDPSSPTTITLTGTAAALQFSSLNLSFGTADVQKNSSPATVTVTNVGSAAVNISSIVIGGAVPGDFVIQSNTCGASLNPGANCAVTLTFLPQAVGLSTANLTFTDSDVTSPQAIAMAGRGVALTKTTLSVDVNPATAGQTVHFTAVVSPSTATGNVQFVDNFNGTKTTLGSVPLSAGTAVLATPLASGTHSIAAAYGGDTNDTSSTSAPLAETVN